MKGLFTLFAIAVLLLGCASTQGEKEAPQQKSEVKEKESQQKEEPSEGTAQKEPVLPEAGPVTEAIGEPTKETTESDDELFRSLGIDMEDGFAKSLEELESLRKLE